jgi:hypothetical protein
MHINDYRHGRPFSFSQDSGHQLLGQLLGHANNIDLCATRAEPFAYYCLAPWPKHDNLGRAVVRPSTPISSPFDN